MLKSFLVFLLITISIFLQAQDRLFTYSYQSNVLSNKRSELEFYNTFRAGKEDYFLRHDFRAEFEIGLTKRIQSAFYLNVSSKTIAINTEEGKELKTTTKIGFSNEWKLKISDPSIHPMGMGLYFEYGIGNQEYELEGKLILDKYIGDFLIATNLNYEIEFEPEYDQGKFKFEKEQSIDLYFSMAYPLKQGFYITSETLIKNKLETKLIEHNAIFSGLGFSYAKNNYWINFTALPQIISLKNQNINKSLNLSEYEKFKIRLLFSVSL